MSFRFNFSNAPDSDDELDTSLSGPAQHASSPAPSLVPPKVHNLRSLASMIPRNISYNTLYLTPALSLSRRELYDVRMQLMSEENPFSAPSSAPAGNDLLTTSATTDVLKNVYEGGLKSWECSLDLARFLSANAANQPVPPRVLELGCGSALPTLYFFQEILRAGEKARGSRLVLADYNIDVLRLVTLPNLFLVWAREEQKWLPDEGDLDASPSLVERFVDDLERRGIELGFVEGAWGPDMVRMLNPDIGKGAYTVVLASETIYEPMAMESFVSTLLGSLDVNAGGVGLVAAKKHYFGVGGGIQDFMAKVRERGGWETGIVEETGEAGVRRCIVQIGRQS
ncbi:hypothetical protein EX30DRAFT_394533 [Ascodesmis nigricans]|uniref:protein-histidine N-methyltransferase n=1 Tax=Ascodesmis nigricans TaxID=341454 RepID=A0A4S2N2B4_9PEZI|nr:hypothetical protein EX30DRAFT_394533 [Ascodesmis nigricans]